MIAPLPVESECSPECRWMPITLGDEGGSNAPQRCGHCSENIERSVRLRRQSTSPLLAANGSSVREKRSGAGTQRASALARSPFPHATHAPVRHVGPSQLPSGQVRASRLPSRPRRIRTLTNATKTMGGAAPFGAGFADSRARDFTSKKSNRRFRMQLRRCI